MRNPMIVLNNLTSKSKNKNYKFERIYRNLYNPEFFLKAYSKIAPNEGNMTEGVDGNTIDGMSIERIEQIIEKLKNESYQPKPSRRTYIPKKNGDKRPLGIPSIDDKLVQEVIRMLLESIYENNFEDTSHGFRPMRSCHSALNQAQKKFIGAKWFIEGDIKGFFDNIDHDILIGILKEKINDDKFIRLIRKFLNAGYMEDWKFHKTFSGTPQGGIISPLLSNIYLDKLDKFMMNMKENIDKGKTRQRNPIYHNASNSIYKRKKRLETLLNKETKDHEVILQIEKIKNEIEKHKQIQKNLKPSMPMDNDFRRLQYVRYADDFIIGYIGSKNEAIEIKNQIAEFLKNVLKIDLSLEKTLITNAKDKARFLGYDIYVSNNDRIKKNVKGHKTKSISGKVTLEVPHEKWRNKLIELKALKIDKSNKWVATHRADLTANSDLEILNIYNAEIRGFYNYYKIANNASVLNRYFHFMKYSMFKTFANKYKTSIRKINKKHTINNDFGVKYKTTKGNKIAYLYREGFKKQEYTKKEVNPDIKINTHPYKNRTELEKRLLANKCEWCYTETNDIEIHHVKKLKNLKGKKHWEKFMIARKRKTMALCKKCHIDLHRGKLD